MTQYRSESKGRKDKEPGLELSIGQVLAAAGATVVGALLAKLLNIWGTVAGTAVLSICSSIGAVLILRAMRSTGERIKTQIAAMAPTARGKATAATVELGPEGATATAKVPEASELHSTQDATVPIEVPDPGAPEDEDGKGHVIRTRSRKRTLIAILVSSVLVFGLTIGTLFLLGVFTGDPGRFIGDDPRGGVSETQTETVDPSESATTEPSESASEAPSDTPSTDAPTGDAEPSESTSPSGEATTPSEPATGDTGQGGAEPTPSTSPEAQDDEDAAVSDPGTTAG
ncbi:hypothetical protein SAMN05216298_1203 [Glycomyces sambucus]|uniref:Uncharacterized protein n=1 Tax=Glycomyces sambucus TaxID=380244 RepID=A0A1G9DZL8_9ACTN|nr:hypothetical protein [Glycomyces sambucus]SDK69332.1 hypothetical protein SAMN05216298_1203 [Glycomyces sambucus]